MAGKCDTLKLEIHVVQCFGYMYENHEPICYSDEVKQKRVRASPEFEITFEGCTFLEFYFIKNFDTKSHISFLLIG